MTPLTDRTNASGEAMRAVESAATAASVVIRDVRDLDDVFRATALFDSVWQVADGASILPTNLARALSHAGSYFAAAFDCAGGDMLGAIVGFIGFSDGPHLHSHILGVLAPDRRGGIGFALKEHQRAWAMEHGLSEVSWTFDPLVRRNAYFNLCKLGAELTQYHVNFYGEMNDGVNAGDETDRALVTWNINSSRAEAAARGDRVEPDIDRLRADGAVAILDEDSNASPKVSESRDGVLLCRIPADIVALRQSDPQLALSWRKALRDTLASALGDGYRATGMSRSGWYVLEREREKSR